MMPSTPDNEKYLLSPIEDQDLSTDPLYYQSLNFIINTGLKDMTVKDIQFHFRIGYNRAANILEQIRLNNQNIK